VTDTFDVIVVGARCAGSPLATLLARRGLKVCVVDRARFPSEVPSTHMFHPSGVARLERLGVLDRVLATGAPPLDRGSFLFNDVRFDAAPGLMGRFGAPWLCVRRVTLDPLLIQIAEEAGAQVRTQTAVVGLVEEDGAVRGVRTHGGTLRAALVVGADGPHSAVARFAGSREYHVTHAERFCAVGYFEHAAERHATARLGKIGDVAFAAMPTDGGLFMAALFLPEAMRSTYLADTDRSFAQGVAQIDEIAEMLGPANRVGPLRLMGRWRGYFREATGPGWVLVGDAGHFKDPAPAQGMSDALRQAERLAETIAAGLGDRDVAGRLAAWWEWRDQDAWEMYWFANQGGAAGPMSRVAVEMLRGLSRETDGPERFLRVLNHDLAPSALFTAGRGLRALATAAAARPRALPQLLSETRVLAASQFRQRRRRRPTVFQRAD